MLQEETVRTPFFATGFQHYQSAMQKDCGMQNLGLIPNEANLMLNLLAFFIHIPGTSLV